MKTISVSVNLQIEELSPIDDSLPNQLRLLAAVLE